MDSDTHPGPSESAEGPAQQTETLVKAFIKWVEELPRERLLLWKGLFDSLMHLASVSSLETLEEIITGLKDSSTRLELSSKRLQWLTIALVLETAVLAVLTALLLFR